MVFDDFSLIVILSISKLLQSLTSAWTSRLESKNTRGNELSIVIFLLAYRFDAGKLSQSDTAPVPGSALVLSLLRSSTR